MKKYQYTYKDKYFNTMIIGGYVIRIKPDQDSWEKIYNKHLKPNGVIWEEYVTFLVSCISTVLEDKNIVCMEFIKEFIDGQYSFEAFGNESAKSIIVKLIYGEK